MTTIHVDDVVGIPDRMYNMLGEQNVSERFVNSIYQYIDVGILVECDKNERRKITQVAFFNRKDGNNQAVVYYDNGNYTGNELPEDILNKFKKYNV